MQRLWATVPQDQKEWIKNFHTQERPWGLGDKIIWKEITKNAKIDENQLTYLDSLDPTIVLSGGTKFDNVMETAIFTRPADHKDLPFEVKKNKYVR